MNEEDMVYTGHVARFDSEKNFGFIEIITGDSYFFFFNKTEQVKRKKTGQIASIHKFASGDEVAFKLRKSSKYPKQLEAYDVQFIKNEKRQMLIAEAAVSPHLVGYLKLVDNEKYFVKHKSTYVFIPLEISAWETDLAHVYTNRINQPVNFRLTQIQKSDKLKARLMDARYIGEFHTLNTAKEQMLSLPATITGRNSKGLFATVLEGRIEGFINRPSPDEPAAAQFGKLRKGSNASVHVKNLFNNRKISLTLADV